MLSGRSVIFALAGCLFTVISLALLHPATRHTLCNSPPSQPRPVPTQQRTLPKLHLLLPINARVAGASPNFCKTLLSTLVHGYEPTILNWSVDGDSGFMQRMKVFGVYEYLTNITDKNADSDLVFMMDALDIWLQLSPRTLIERFKELGAYGVVLGADKACWPNEWESPACQTVPESTLPTSVYGGNGELEESGMPHTRPRWANSGTIIGSVAAMRALYKDLVNIFQDPQKQIDSDQGIFNEFLAARRLSLDYRSRLFWATASADPTATAHFLNTPYHIDAVIPHELYPPLLHQSQTGEVPIAIHFNDHTQKGLMDGWWGKLWWNKLHDGDERFRNIVSSRVEGAAVKFAGEGWKSWREICPKDTLDI